MRDAELIRMRGRIERLRGLCKSLLGMLVDRDIDPAERDRLYDLIGDMEPPLESEERNSDVPREPEWRGNVWPFVESPGDLAARLREAMLENGGYMLGAVRRVFIEEPAAIRSPEDARAFHASQLAAATPPRDGVRPEPRCTCGTREFLHSAGCPMATASMAVDGTKLTRI